MFPFFSSLKRSFSAHDNNSGRRSPMVMLRSISEPSCLVPSPSVRRQQPLMAAPATENLIVAPPRVLRKPVPTAPVTFKLPSPRARAVASARPGALKPSASLRSVTGEVSDKLTTMGRSLSQRLRNGYDTDRDFLGGMVLRGPQSDAPDAPWVSYDGVVSSTAFTAPRSKAPVFQNSVTGQGLAPRNVNPPAQQQSEQGQSVGAGNGPGTLRNSSATLSTASWGSVSLPSTLQSARSSLLSFESTSATSNSVVFATAGSITSQGHTPKSRAGGTTSALSSTLGFIFSRGRTINSRAGDRNSALSSTDVSIFSRGHASQSSVGAFSFAPSLFTPAAPGHLELQGLNYVPVGPLKRYQLLPFLPMGKTPLIQASDLSAALRDFWQL